MRDLMPFIRDLQALPEGAAWGEGPLVLKDVSALLRQHKIDGNERDILFRTPGRYGFTPNGSVRGWHWKLRAWACAPASVKEYK